jgi:hypothetical protein
MGLRCDDGPRGRPRFLAGTAAVRCIARSERHEQSYK